jgi:hypothetical protein
MDGFRRALRVLEKQLELKSQEYSMPLSPLVKRNAANCFPVINQAERVLKEPEQRGVAGVSGAPERCALSDRKPRRQRCEGALQQLHACERVRVSEVCV